MIVALIASVISGRVEIIDSKKLHRVNQATSSKTRALTFTDLAGSQFADSFVSDDFYENGPYRNIVPYRKPPRHITEVVPGFLWADAADFQEHGTPERFRNIWVQPLGPE